jgi:hypothetical protein
MADASTWEPIVTVAAGIIGVATLAVLVSKNSNTVGVVNAAGSAFSGSLATALSPVTGTGGSSGYYGASGSSLFPIG